MTEATIIVPKCPHCGHTNYKVDPTNFQPRQCLNCGKNPRHFSENEREKFAKAHKKAWGTSMDGKEQGAAPTCIHCTNRTWDYAHNVRMGRWIVAHCKKCGKNFSGAQPTVEEVENLMCLKYDVDSLDDFYKQQVSIKKAVGQYAHSHRPARANDENANMDGGLGDEVLADTPDGEPPETEGDIPEKTPDESPTPETSDKDPETEPVDDGKTPEEGSPDPEAEELPEDEITPFGDDDGDEAKPKKEADDASDDEHGGDETTESDK